MLLDILNIIGIIACAVTGALQAGRVKMDYFGVVVIAMVTGLGGGTIRDVMFQNYPLSWIGEPNYLYVACGFAIITIIVAPFMRYLKTVFLILDAMGMIAFSLLGAQVAMNLGYGVTLASVAGVCTGVFGGVIRDLLCNRIPIAFKHELYASISLATVFVYYFMLKFGLGYGFSVVVSVLFGFIFRVLAIRYNWSLPIFDYDDDKYLNVNFLENLPHKRLKRKVRQLAIHYYRKKHPYRKKVKQANLTILTEEPTSSDLSNMIKAGHIDYDLPPLVEQVSEQVPEPNGEFTEQVQAQVNSQKSTVLSSCSTNNADLTVTDNSKSLDNDDSNTIDAGQDAIIAQNYDLEATYMQLANQQYQTESSYSSATTSSDSSHYPQAKDYSNTNLKVEENSASLPPKQPADS